MNARRMIRRSAKTYRALGQFGPYGQVGARREADRERRQILGFMREERDALEKAKTGEAS